MGMRASVLLRVTTRVSGQIHFARASAQQGNGMKFRNLLLGALAATTSVVAASAALAGAAWEFTSPGNSYTDGTWDFAAAFTVNSTVTVSGLGYYADPTTGNVDGNPVALYQCADTACLTTGTLLASTNVTNTYAIDGHFRYVTIAPITLIAGDSYEVAGVSNSDDYTWDDPGFTVDSSISLLNTSGQYSRWEATGSPDFLTGSGYLDLGSEDGYWGPNLFLGSSSGFTGTPEPATWMMMLVGIGGLGAAMRARRGSGAVARF